MGYRDFEWIFRILSVAVRFLFSHRKTLLLASRNFSVFSRGIPFTDTDFPTGGTISVHFFLGSRQYFSKTNDDTSVLFSLISVLLTLAPGWERGENALPIRPGCVSKSGFFFKKYVDILA